MKTTHHQHCLMLGKFHDRLSSRNTNAIEMARFWVTRESDLCPPPAVTSCRERRRGSATRRVCTAVFLLCITWHCGKQEYSACGYQKQCITLFSKACIHQVCTGSYASEKVGDNCFFFVFQDRKQVCFITNAFPEHMDSKVFRMQPGGVLRAQPVPPLLPAYNKFMGGVDRTDQLRKTYGFDRKSKRSWLRLFFLL